MTMRRLLTASYEGCSLLSIIDLDKGIEIGMVQSPPSPTWITRSVTGRILVVCSGHVVLLGEGAELNVTSVMKALGNRLVHGCWSTNERFVLAVDYDAGTVEVFPVVLGLLQPATLTYQFLGQGAYPPLQGSPHPHQIVAGPGQRYCITDLGTDR
jgi:6-phosphogluconolactonase (cycloisomerase 2 family)